MKYHYLPNSKDGRGRMMKCCFSRRFFHALRTLMQPVLDPMATSGLLPPFPARRRGAHFNAAESMQEIVDKQIPHQLRRSADIDANVFDWSLASPMKAQKMKDFQCLGGRLRPVMSLSHLEKTMADSFFTSTLPFASDAGFKANYLNFKGLVRIGMMLEEIDRFASIIAHAHMDDDAHDTEPCVLVTASTDRIDSIEFPIPTTSDLQLQGCVTYVGTTSLNIDVDLIVPAQGEEPVRVLAVFGLTFAARNSLNKSVPVPRLKVTTERDQILYNDAKKHFWMRKDMRAKALARVPPTVDELSMVHKKAQLCGERTVRTTKGSPMFPPDSNCVFAQDTETVSTMITMPQDRNFHGKVFGGKIMKEAYEIAYVLGWKLTGHTPIFVSLNEVNFFAPVDVGCILKFTARAHWSSGNMYIVSVTATVRNPSKQNVVAGEAIKSTGHTLTNDFSFLLKSDGPTPVPDVFFRSYTDAMQFVAAHRHFVVGKAVMEARTIDGGAVQPRFQ